MAPEYFSVLIFVLIFPAFIATSSPIIQFMPWPQVHVVCEQLDSEQDVSPVTTHEHLVGRVQ